MAYQTLKKVAKKTTQKPQVTITKDAFRFNKAAREEFELDGFNHAELMSNDQDVSKLAVKLLKDPTEDSNKLSKGVLSATAWIAPYGLKLGTYDLKLSDLEQTLELLPEAAAA